MIVNNYLLDLIDYEFVCKLPCDNNPISVAARARSRNIDILTGLGLIKFNVEYEAQRLRINDQRMINLTSSHIWSFHLTSSQKEKFMALADKVNNINHDIRQANTENLNRIFRLNNIQDNIPLFNGVNFYDDNGGLESLFLPAGNGGTFP
ncbi:hypothetical protein RclHR1_01330028 [Rhizophagus clarus]|uniref:Uncharacterized protein n=1 Tax=Rhizophagus clarus TaxID=94130 RepID=A0A2Z6QPN5_9GLOM|nr:hypothetical protein RclHR1_01330028 [Rhizophagus clarus]GES79871.1 hypothetical protein GLOIN_2v1536525 [Rhizophagus clarus]